MDKIKIALIGCGYWGKNYLNLFAKGAISNSVLKYVQDVKNLDLSNTNGVIFTQDIDTVLNDPEISGVIIVTPTRTHFEIASRAIQAGKHVLLEKPITASLDEASKLNDLAAKHNKVLMAGHIFKHNLALKEIKRRIDSGEIGQIKYLDSRRVALGPIRNDASVLWDLVTHDIYIFIYLTGKYPTAISCTGESYNHGIDDIVSVNMRFPNKVFGSIYANWGHPIKERKIIVGGTKKAVLFDDVHPSEKVTIYDKAVEYLPSPSTFAEFQAGTREGDILIPKISLAEPLERQLNHFIRCIEGREECISPCKEGMEVVRILEAAEKSRRNGGAEVKLD